jgi:hypothetical protein
VSPAMIWVRELVAGPPSKGGNRKRLFGGPSRPKGSGAWPGKWCIRQKVNEPMNGPCVYLNMARSRLKVFLHLPASFCI